MFLPNKKKLAKRKIIAKWHKSLTFLGQITPTTLRKIRYFHLVSWFWSFVERCSFYIVSGESPEAMQKIYLSTKIPHQGIRWNCGILRSTSQGNTEICLKKCMKNVQVGVFLVHIFPYSNWIWIKTT